MGRASHSGNVVLGIITGVSPSTPSSNALDVLRRRFGPLEYIGGGRHSQVYRIGNTDDQPARSIKVYREATGMHRLEAANMQRVGLGLGQVEPLEVSGVELLLMPFIAGREITAPDIVGAMPQLSQFLRRLYHIGSQKAVDLTVVAEKIALFRPVLPTSTAVLFETVEHALAASILSTEARLCHLDLWQANILINPASGELHVLDWARSDWDDPARDLAILKTGTLDLLPAPEAAALARQLAASIGQGIPERLGAHLALQTLHDLYWFSQQQPAGFAEALAFKVPRALDFLALTATP
jgi:hypothetical protein